jgi:hypothetical protein
MWTMASKTSTRLVLAAAFFVLFAVVALLFWRLADTLGVAETEGSPPTATVAPPPSGPDAGTSVTGSLPPAAGRPTQPAPDPTTGMPSATTPDPVTSSPGTTDRPDEEPVPGTVGPGEESAPSAPESFPDPAAWPSDLPSLGEHQVLDYSTGDAERWLLAVPGGAQIAGGRFIGGLTRLEWKVSSMSTDHTVTAVGQFDAKRVSVVLRPGDGALPEGWSYLEVIYSPFIPQFSPPTTTPDEDASVRGRA